jgi:hypothetical protein
VDHDCVRVTVGQPVDRGLAAVGGAVAGDPEHAFGRGIGFLGHDLIDQLGERVDSGGVAAESDHVGSVDVVGGQVSQGPAAVVFVLDAHRA